MTTTLTEIAAAIRKHSPGVLPDISTELELTGFNTYETVWCGVDARFGDDIARHVLGFAMVVDAGIRRDWFISDGDLEGDTETEYWWYAHNPVLDDGMDFPDADYGGDPLMSLYAAWKWARGIDAQ